VKRALVAAVLIAALTAAGSASARTYTLFAGKAGSSSGATWQNLNDFFPHTLSVRKGDKVKVVSNFFHTATILGSANPANFALLGPDPAGSTYAATPPDAAGAPWFFNTLTKFLYNPLVFQPGGGTTVTSRTATYNTGVLVGGDFAPVFPGVPSNYTLTFNKVGTFTIVCLVHPGMAGKVVVKRQSARVPAPARAKVTANTQIAAGFVVTAGLASTSVPANTVYAGVGGNQTLLSFLPRSITVPAGTTVTFETKSPTEAHTVLFGPMSFLGPFMGATDMLPFTAGSPNQVFPFNVYGSDPAAADGSYTYTGATMHGDGTFATPVIDLDPNSPPGTSVKVKFTVPGTYTYFCQLHGPAMAGTVVVT
jgi:plastocyanin